MKYILSIVCFWLFITPALSDEISRNSGDKSLNFSFSDFAVEEYKIGIGGKYWTSTEIAFTASINFQNNESKTESSSGTPANSDTEARYYGLSIGIEKHFTSSTKLSPYIGGEAYYLESDADISNNINASASEWGINALLGAEYAINKSLAFAAEYSLGYSDSEIKSTNNLSQTTTTTDKGFGLGTGKLILLLYF